MAQKVFALVDYQDEYVQPLLVSALQDLLPPEILVLIKEYPTQLEDNFNLLIWRQYEDIDFERLMSNSSSYCANSYVIRKALIRKHYLSNTISHWLSKHPDSTVQKHIKPSVEFELDYSEFLDDALLEAYELHESWAKNESCSDDVKEWWILKPGMSERGQGIRLFSTETELTAIFEQWDPDSSDEEDEQEQNHDTTNNITTSHLRHFIAQPYIHPPLLLESSLPFSNHKFHIRTYVLAVGALKVYVYKPMLALFASKPYTAPSSVANDSLDAHLTNTCMQDSGLRDGIVREFWSLTETATSLSTDMRADWKQHVFEQICSIVSTVFEAAAKTSSIHFQAIPNAFEIFGVDFLVDAEGCAWLLEVNAFPDFAQTGDDLRGLISGLMRCVVTKAVAPFFSVNVSRQEKNEEMIEVLDVDLGRH
ncbi:hypothetical protein MRB53_040081 [Persea americana]|nr:hypothetical protein MRB53_040081 [Persea americana]